MKPVLKLHDQGAFVRELTAALLERGHLDRAQDAFDLTVRRAVEEFQARHVDERGVPLVVDGIVGPLTWWALAHPDNSGVLNQPGGVVIPPVGGSALGRAALE
ncbi:MAG: peptidoglycan-binding protein, partial [Proteobacteria bacterium]